MEPQEQEGEQVRTSVELQVEQQSPYFCLENMGVVQFPAMGVMPDWSRLMVSRQKLTIPDVFLHDSEGRVVFVLEVYSLLLLIP